MVHISTLTDIYFFLPWTQQTRAFSHTSVIPVIAIDAPIPPYTGYLFDPPILPRAMGRLMMALHPELLYASFRALALLGERLEEAGLGPLLRLSRWRIRTTWKRRWKMRRGC